MLRLKYPTQSYNLPPTLEIISRNFQNNLNFSKLPKLQVSAFFYFLTFEKGKLLYIHILTQYHQIPATTALC